MSTIVIRGKKNRVKKPKAKKVSDVVKDYVNRALDRAIEDKLFVWREIDIPILPSNSATFGASVKVVTPYAGFTQIDQGVGAGQRTGNRIKIKKLYVDVIMHPQPYNASTNAVPLPCDIIFWFYTFRGDPTILSAPSTSFLQLGNGSDALTSTIEDTIAMVNNDSFKLWKKKVFKLGYSSYEGTTGTASFTLAAQNFTNNDYKLNISHRFDLTNDIVKTIIYNDNNSLPNTRCICMLAQAVASNGALLSATTIPALYNYSIVTVYEDA